MSKISDLNMILVSNLNKVVPTSEGELEILKNINFKVKEGETVAVVGASGSGKSTLLGLLAGLDQPTSGKIIVHNQAMHEMNEEQRAQFRGQYIGFIFQSFMLVQSLTALENVMLPAELKGDDDAMEKAKGLLSQVGLADRLDHYPNQLSGGEQQRVAIARAFISKPHILYADEPSANLDTKNGHLIEDLLFELNEKYRTTLILVTHDNELAQRCQRRLEMTGGELKDLGEENRYAG
ncbi:ABC transporter ATP-binding protein [Flocculibacter collagenilyticus]|uniref:ABC transporter ATP-binding protein n=1 Tax=Flocculibacter collagenilyticus TaxID=2744479 RepID=UPI0018F736A4|nr:ABC transporter ATP-binding protein [Flocculibacter collagenilyticus]